MTSNLYRNLFMFAYEAGQDHGGRNTLRIRAAFPWSKTVNIKVPAPCCKWCDIQCKALAQRTENLEQRVAESEGRSTVDHSLAVFNAKLEAAVRLFDHAVNADARRGYFVTDPVALTEVFRTAFEVVESVTGNPKPGGPPEGAKLLKAALNEIFVPMSSLDGHGEKDLTAHHEDEVPETV